MVWVRLDCSFPRNPKVLELVQRKAWRAVTAYVAGLAYSGEHGLDGWLPLPCLPFLHATVREADQLVAVRLWLPGHGGWDINDWDAYQPSAEQMQARKTRAKHAAEQRWRKARAGPLAVHEGGD